jgi:hypothetical protein
VRFLSYFQKVALVASLGLALSVGWNGGGREAFAASKAAEAASDGAYRAKAGQVDLFLPANFAPTNGTYDVVVHFHGLAKAQESNVTEAGLNAAVISVNLGVASAKYSAAFRDPHAFDRLLTKTQRMVARSGRAKGAKIGRIALSAWSAGFASVSAILKQESARSRVDAVLLADGLHAAYADPKNHVIEERSLAKYVHLTEQAMRGEKLFVLTHSSIPTYGYPNVNDTVGAVLRLASVEKGSPPSSSPRSMHALYQIHRGDFYVTGFEGRGVSDHIDHIWAMGETMFPLLAARWNRQQTVT